MFMYLGNDVIQNSKKKGPEYSKEFGKILPKVPTVYRDLFSNYLPFYISMK